MKKKVKKIPKYNVGGSVLGTIAKNNLPKLSTSFKSPMGGSSTGFTGRSLGSGGDSAAGEAGSSLSMPGGIATASNEILMNTLGIEDNSKAGVTLNSAAQGSDIGGSFVPGWGHLIGAVAGGLVGSLKKGGVDPNTGEIQYGGIFGRSESSLQRESNMVKGSILAKARTEDLKADWMNQGIDPAPNVLAAEGGIVPGEHYASRGEVEVAADGTNAVRYGWDPKGKDTYHVYTNPDGSSAVGNMVFTEEGVKRPNGEKYSDAAEKIIKGTKEGSKLRQISLRKLANEMEELKMGKEIKKLKRGIPAHEGGKTGKEELAAEIAARKRLALDPTKMAIIELPDGTRVLQDLYGNQYNFEDFGIVDMGDQPTTYTGVAPSAGKWNGSMNFAKQILNSKNVAKLRNTMTKVLPKGVKPATPSTVGKGVNAAQAQKEMLNNDRTFQMWQRLGNKGGVPAKTVESNVTAYRDASKASRNLWELTPTQQAASNAAAEQAIYDGMVKHNLPYWLTLTGMIGGAGTFLTYEALKDGMNLLGEPAVMLNPNQSTEQMVKTDNVSTTSKQEPDQTSIIEPTKTIVTETPVKKSSKKTASKKIKNDQQNLVSIPMPTVTSKLNTDKFGTSTPSFDVSKISNNNYRFAPARNDAPITDGYQSSAMNTKSRTDWQDALYRTAVLTQPLWDRAKAEPVQYEIPVAKYVPIGMNIDPAFNAIDESMALARYNQLNINPNTGAGMAYGLLAAANRAKQYADAYKWQQDVQNKQIAQNVGIYNNWDTQRTETLNDVFDKTAANTATARNINRKNATSALNNWGTMLNNDDKKAIEKMKFKILEPAIRSTYEDATANDLINIYNSLFG